MSYVAILFVSVCLIIMILMEIIIAYFVRYYPDDTGKD